MKSSNKALAFEGLEINVYRSDRDNKLVVEITGPGQGGCTEGDEPDIRIWLNEALIYRSGEVGDDLSGGA